MQDKRTYEVQKILMSPYPGSCNGKGKTGY